MILPTLLRRIDLKAGAEGVVGTVTAAATTIAPTITDAGKDVAPTITDAGKDVAPTITDAGKTLTGAGKQVADQGEGALSMFKEGSNAFQQMKQLMDFWKAHQDAIIYAAYALLGLIILSLLIMLYQCISCCRGCCCKPKEQHKEDAHAKDPPPSPTPIKCFNATMCHWDTTHTARGCGTIPIRRSDAHNWNILGHREGWLRSLGRGDWKWPGKRTYKEWRVRVEERKRVQPEMRENEVYQEKGKVLNKLLPHRRTVTPPPDNISNI